MSGLQRLFLRITPIIMLICFICFGITHTFGTEGQQNLTYLSQETIEIGTQEEPKQIKVYTFDTKSYLENINPNKLKSATTNVFSIDAYKSNLNEFKAIWNNGYQMGDVLKTIANGILLVVNTLLTPINILLFPLRIISAILLTGMSIVGININNNTPIIKFLRSFMENGSIPLIARTGTVEEYHDATDQLEGIWSIISPNEYSYIEYNFNFTTYFEEARYKGIEISNGNMYYIAMNNEKILVYTNEQWINPELKQDVIQIGAITNNEYQILEFMNKIASKWDE